MKIVVGLGNPGPKYGRTRHNMGFMVVDRLAERLGVKVEGKRFHALVGEKVIDGETLLLVKPLTYVNESGRTVRELQKNYSCPVDSIMVICDDLNLPLGKLRIRRRGSSGGHNGLESVMSCLESKDFPRLRVGIGHPLHGEAREYVLSPFLKEEKEELEGALERANEALLDWISGGVEECMKRFN
ncbi:MAG TPA: aminoacyl-tRNA hydrolase [Candidatus Brocadiales bacterium]|nr:aminoacyl-tRNA hydrolase [Candidatus Brocadiales bacterium]